MRRRISGVAAALFTAAALVVAGCSSTAATGNGSGSGTAAGGQTVEVKDIGGLGPTLVTADGKTLYFADQDSGSQIECVQGCLHFWTPLTVPSGAMPTGTGDLSTINRPDGPTQVLFHGKPLYTFTLDGGAGKADGNGVTDAFSGTTFTWHAATVSGSAAPTTPSPGSSGGYRY
jgi:predicted lipoprotein with Yx(FWY)xxD motif